MDRADSCRRAAREAVADVEPPALHDRIEATLDEASMVPAVLTLESAAATAADGRGIPEIDPDQPGGLAFDPQSGELPTRAAGVQLIYEGLRLTRALAHEEPWDAVETADADAGDLEILAADILVARGFYLLARTDAASKAVETVQAFGRDQTRRDALVDGDGTAGEDGNSSVDPPVIDANLERDVLELAVLTGAAAVGTAPSQRLLEAAAAIADDVGAGFPPVSAGLDDIEPSIPDQLDDHPTDRATSATDP